MRLTLCEQRIFVTQTSPCSSQTTRARRILPTRNTPKHRKVPRPALPLAQSLGEAWDGWRELAPWPYLGWDLSSRLGPSWRHWLAQARAAQLAARAGVWVGWGFLNTRASAPKAGG